jgi:hypothetical protein
LYDEIEMSAEELVQIPTRILALMALNKYIANLRKEQEDTLQTGYLMDAQSRQYK